MKYDVSQGNEARKWNQDESVRCDGISRPLAFADGRITLTTNQNAKKILYENIVVVVFLTGAHVCCSDTWKYHKVLLYRSERTYSCARDVMANMLLSSKSAYTRLYHTIRLLRFTLKASISSTCSSLCTFAHYQMWHVHTNVCRFNFLLERAPNKFRYFLFLKIRFDFIFWSLLALNRFLLFQFASFKIQTVCGMNLSWLVNIYGKIDWKINEYSLR